MEVLYFMQFVIVPNFSYFIKVCKIVMFIVWQRLNENRNCASILNLYWCSFFSFNCILFEKLEIQVKSKSCLKCLLVLGICSSIKWDF